MIRYTITEEEILPFIKPIEALEIDELRRAVKCRVYDRSDSKFELHSRLFNGGVRTRATLVVVPLDAYDVSQTVLFCSRHSLTPSVKSGGYGTHGWSVEGDVVIDMSEMTDVEMSVDFIPMEQKPPAEDLMQTDPRGPHLWPSSLLAIGEPPDILPSRRRKADEAFGDAGDKERDLEASRPAALPIQSMHDHHNLALQPGSASQPIPAADCTTEDSSASARRIRPRHKSPEAFPAPLDAILNRVRDRPTPPNVGPPKRETSLFVNVPTHQSSTSLDNMLTPGSGSHLGSESGSGSRSGGDSTMGSARDDRSKHSATQSPRTSSDDDEPRKDNTPTLSAGVVGGSPSDLRSSGSPGGYGSVFPVALPPLVSPPSDGRSSDNLASTREAPSSTSISSSAHEPSRSIRAPPSVGGPFGYPAPPPGNPAIFTTALPSSVPGPFSYSEAPQPSTSGSGSLSAPSAPQPRLVLHPDLETSTSQSPPNSTNPTAYPVEPEHPFVYVSFGAGAGQRDVDAYTNANPYKGTSASGQIVDVPYYVPWAAHPVGSTVMMLGGFGFLSRLHGLSLDVVVEVEMVLADGRIVTVSETENADLWWGLRGAGTAFGVATRYKAKAFPVPVVYAGNIIYEFSRATAPSLVKHFRDCIKSAPRELYANLILTAGPRNDGALVVIQLCYIGTRERGAEFLQAILSWDGGQCLLNEVNEKTFWNQQDSVTKVLKAASGRKWFIRSDLVNSLTDDVIHATVMKFADTPDGCAWLFELGGGAMVDFKDTCIPLASRQAGFNIVAFHQWRIDEYDDRCVDSAEEWMVETIAKHSPGGPLPCFFERCERVSRTIASYGDDNWHRLCLLKRKYDPTGLIRHCFWPLDEEGRPLGLDEDMVDRGDDTEHNEDGAEGRTLGEAPSAIRGGEGVSTRAGDEASDSKDKAKVKKGKGKEDLRTGNHFMDRLLLP